MKFLCAYCSIYVYDSEKGDPSSGAMPGVVPKDFPEEWRCPVCGKPREYMQAVSEDIYANKLEHYSKTSAALPGEVQKHDINYYRSVARKQLTGICGEYNVCNGGPDRMCYGQKFGAPIGFGGAGQSNTFHENYLALKRYKLKERLVKKHVDPDLTLTLFGRKLVAPVFPAPMSGVRNSMADVMPEEDFYRAILKGAMAFGNFGFVGNTALVPDDTGLEAVKEVGAGVPVFKPQSQERLLDLLKKCDVPEVLAVGVDLDGAGSTTWARLGKPVYRKSEGELREIVDSTSKPVLFKGVVSIEDARAVFDSGAAAIGVSNHGGRVLDSGLGVADVLPEITKELKGKITILADGAVRTGFDVLKILALGADAALIGRPLARMAISGGAEAVRMYLDYVEGDLRSAMVMTGCDRLDEATRDILTLLPEREGGPDAFM
ncbi:MAG TPA: alpha-hydroxy-acid oxidizing protein [Methanomassiliicoccales archaeon]|nr:alpha-hydroxy-acid oxidizing protein [Methanomassiliicoccales archaeon]